MLTPLNTKIRLYSGELYDPLDPDYKLITVENTAHALSNLCRFGGHCSEFYSVAQHAVLASILVEAFHPEANEELETQHHDDSEGSGLVDIPRPVKHAPGMETYRKIEDKNQRAAEKAYNLKPISECKWVKWADHQMLVSEMRVLAPKSYPYYSQKLKEKGYEEIEIMIKPWSPAEAKSMFILRHNRLTKERFFSERDQLYSSNYFII